MPLDSASALRTIARYGQRDWLSAEQRLADMLRVANQALSESALPEAMSAPTPSSANHPALSQIFVSFAANRCYACGWPMNGGCQPFNCSMRYTERSPEHAGWLKRATEMAEALRYHTSPSAALPEGLL